MAIVFKKPRTLSRAWVRLRVSPAAMVAGLTLILCWPAAALRIVNDETGRAVRLPDHVHRIICLTPSVADTVFAIGAGPDVVGISDYTVYPPEARQKPSIGDILRPSLERIAALRPDLVVGVAPLNSTETIRGVERLGIPIFLVNETGIEGLYRSIESIGKAVGREREASSLVARLRGREARVRMEAAKAKHPSVFFVISLDPCITAGKRAFITELLAAAGARSVTADLSQEWVHLNIEAIIPKQPDYVLLLRDSPFDIRQMRQSAGWNALEAVRAGRVLRIDDRLQYPSPVAFDSLEDFARQLHSVAR